MQIKPAQATLFVMGVFLPFCPASARETIVQTPSTAWNMEYGDDRCTLARNFGDGDDTTTFALSMYAPGTNISLVVLRKERLRQFKTYRVQFAPDTEYSEISFPLRTKYEDGREGVLLHHYHSFLPQAYWVELVTLAEAAQKKGEEFEWPEWDDAARDARERAVNEFRIEGAFKNDLHLKLGSMAEPMKAMRTCLDELLGHWGIDAEVQRTLSRKPIPLSNPGSWITPSDYPRGLLASGYQGIVHFRLIVNAEGEPTNCVVQGATNPDQFADVSCRSLMRKAKFSPALDAEGKPVMSYWANTVRWVIP